MSLKYEPSSLGATALAPRVDRRAVTSFATNQENRNFDRNFDFGGETNLRRVGGETNLIRVGRETNLISCSVARLRVRVGHLWRDRWTALSGPLS